MSEARVRVSLADGVLEFEGPEKFVADLVEKFTGVIQTALVGETPEATTPAGAEASGNSAAKTQHAAATVAPTVSAPPPPEVAFNDIYAPTAAGVQVLRSLPGSTKAVRTVMLTKLYLYGLQALKQRDTAFFAEIRRACKAHGCLDAKNMATVLKGHRTSFVFGGTGKQQTIRLSAPGREETATLIAQIRAGKGIAQRRQGITPDALRTPSRPKESASTHKASPAGAARS